MPLGHVLILGAGPAGLSTALALAQLSRSQPQSPLHVTVLELRGQPATIGGTINLTPLALRYLDRLGAGAKLRPRGVPCRAIDLVSLRTGRLLGSLWPDIDALRVRRADLVASLLETCREDQNRAVVDIRWGVKAVEICEEGSADGEGKVLVKFEGGDTVEGDVLIGCDGIHSAARRLHVEPEREMTYSGKAVAYGAVQVPEPGKAEMVRSDGAPAIRDTTLISSRYGALMTSFADRERKELHFGAVMSIAAESERSKEGWKARGEDKARVRADVLSRFTGGKIRGMMTTLEKLEDWTLFPVYQLAHGGRWSRGRVMVIGDAAHAMPPQGESTGVAIEDGVLMAHVLSRHSTRTVTQLFADYEQLRRKTIDGLFKESSWRWNNAAIPDSGWLWSIAMEWVTVVFLWFTNRRQEDYFASDVQKLELPQ